MIPPGENSGIIATVSAGTFASIDDALSRLSEAGYLASKEIATCAFLADRMQKPLLVEGPAGAGKT